MGEAVDAYVGIPPLLELDQLQETAGDRAGKQLLHLSQILGQIPQSGYSVRPGFAVSDATMREA